MDKIDTFIEGLFLIKLKIRKDPRGFFVERYNQKDFAKLSLPTEFSQDNFSRSKKNVIRGLHGQASQAKLVGVTSGTIYDVAVDMRKESSTYGQYFGVELSDENGLLLYIPEGFLHGFQVITESADVYYKITSGYDPESELSVNPFDKFLNVRWPNRDLAIISERDRMAPDL